jgi:hypothetical protein
MRFGKYIAKTFLVFAASGAGTAFGVSVVTLGAIAGGQKVLGLKASAEVIENEEKVEENK